VAIFAIFAASFVAAAPLPVIDMHMHPSLGRPKSEQTCAGDEVATFPATGDPTCAHPFRSASTEQDMLHQTLDQYHRFNVRHAVLAGPRELVDRWTAAAPSLFIPASDFSSRPPMEELRAAHASGSIAVFAEVSSQYEGISADDPRLDPYWALAEELNVPVGIHLGLGVQDIFLQDGGKYRVKLMSPFQLEGVLIRHPKLRIYAMHYASPLVDEMIAMLSAYSKLYVDVAANDWNLPRAQFYDELKRLVDAGFSKRIMFGSDVGPFPAAIGAAVRSIEEAPFLSQEQKSDILYNNAARFLRLSPQQIARDHRPLPK
jgi:hypothetical protein